MNKGQRRMIWTWAGCSILLIALIVFDDYWTANAWLRWPLAGAILVALAMGERTSLVDSGNGGRADRVIEAAPWLRWWFVACAFVSFVGAILLLRSGIDVAAIFGFKVIVIAFAVLMGPFLIVSERQKYRERANAI